MARGKDLPVILDTPIMFLLQVYSKKSLNRVTEKLGPEIISPMKVREAQRLICAVFARGAPSIPVAAPLIWCEPWVPSRRAAEP